MTIRLPWSKMRGLRRSIKTVIDNPLQSPRRLHSLTIRIKSTTMAIFPANLYAQALLYFKNQTVKTPADRVRLLQIPDDCLRELDWWNKNLQKWNGRSILPQSPEHTLPVDASNLGWGGVFRDHSVQSLWSKDEACESINWRELRPSTLHCAHFPSFGTPPSAYAQTTPRPRLT